MTFQPTLPTFDHCSGGQAFVRGGLLMGLTLTVTVSRLVNSLWKRANLNVEQSGNAMFLTCF